jgi:hypothetical protein
LTDLHVLTTHEYEISAFDMPSVCLYACEWVHFPWDYVMKAIELVKANIQINSSSQP